LEALQVELTNIDSVTHIKKKAVLANQQEYASIFSTGANGSKQNAFKILFVDKNKSFSKCGCNLHYFDLNTNRGLSTVINWEDVLLKSFAEQGTLKICNRCYRRL
jgi:hypothetical protein